jgi:hypothetical protein
MALENLAMVQHWDKFHHAIIQGCGYWPWIHIFETYNKQHWPHWMQLWDVLFCVFGGVTFQTIVVGKLRWSYMEGPHVELRTMLSS